MSDPVFPGRSFFHGTKANLKTGDLIEPGTRPTMAKGRRLPTCISAGGPSFALFAKGGDSRVQGPWDSDSFL